MTDAPVFEQEPDLPAPGTRWGAGAQSVLPYLTKSLQAKPAASGETRENQQRESVRDTAPHSAA
jgi:hypothetical protein